MPIEIRELVIRATVSEGNESPAASGSGNSPANDNQPDWIATCVEQVLMILQARSER